MHPFYSELPEKSYRYAATVKALMFVIKRKWQEFYLESSDSCRRKQNPYVVAVPFFLPYKQWRSRLKNFPFSGIRSLFPEKCAHCVWKCIQFLGPFLHSSFLVLRCSSPNVTQRKPGAVLSCGLREVEWQHLCFCFCQQSTWGGAQLNTLVHAAFSLCQQ